MEFHFIIIATSMSLKKLYFQETLPSISTISRIRKSINKISHARVHVLKECMPKLNNITLRNKIQSNKLQIDQITPQQILNKIQKYNDLTRREDLILKCIDELAQHRKAIADISSKISKTTEGIIKDPPPIEILEKLEEVMQTNIKMEEALKHKQI